MNHQPQLLAAAAIRFMLAMLAIGVVIMAIGAFSHSEAVGISGGRIILTTLLIGGAWACIRHVNKVRSQAREKGWGRVIWDMFSGAMGVVLLAYLALFIAMGWAFFFMLLRR